VIHHLAVLGPNVTGSSETLCELQEHTKVISFHPSPTETSEVCDIAAITSNRNHYATKIGLYTQ
jgi:hypothetical protein